jgi:hypothetical protein
MAPFDLTPLSGSLAYLFIFGAIGMGFGAALELGGFGDTRKLAAQFYLRDMTVLKTMFTGIVVAALLLFGASSFGLLDMSRVWVNPTFLASEILGGLIMGVGFVIGGFCPGTSLVAAATLKIDGMLFVAGGLVGVWLFGESVGSFEPFWLSTNFGRFTLDDWLGLPAGVVVLLVVVMALAMFWGAEQLERRFGGAQGVILASAGGKVKVAGAAAALAFGALLAVRGQPSAEQRWASAPAAVHQLASERGMLVDPAELVALRKDTNVEVQVLDLRGERDFNLLHLGGARRIDPAALEQPTEVKRLLDRKPSTVTFLIGNGETSAVETWKRLEGQGLRNLYVVEGGLNRWLERYPPPTCAATPAPAADDALAWRFNYATGDRLPSSSPELPTSQRFHAPCSSEVASESPAGHGHHGIVWPEPAYQKRVKLQTRTIVKGGCG